MLAKKILPEKFDFMRKQGFGFPVNELFRSGKWHDFLLNRVNSENNHFLDKAYCNHLLEQQALGKNLGEQLFAIALEDHGVELDSTLNKTNLINKVYELYNK